jgi:hypothetical protein
LSLLEPILVKGPACGLEIGSVLRPCRNYCVRLLGWDMEGVHQDDRFLTLAVELVLDRDEIVPFLQLIVASVAATASAKCWSM